VKGKKAKKRHVSYDKHEKIGELLEKYNSMFYTPLERKTFAEELIKELSPFIQKTINKYVKKYPSLNPEDLFQEASIGVLNAIERFNPKRKARFLSYLHYWIRVYIERYIARNLTVVSAPINLVHVYSNRKRSKSEEELLRKYKITEQYLEKLKDYERVRVYSLTPDTGNQEIVEKALNIPAPECYSPEESYAKEEMHKVIAELCMRFSLTLNEKERYIFYACLYTNEPKKAAEVGRRFGITKERARQIKRTVQEKFKKFFYQNVPDAENYKIFI